MLRHVSDTGSDSWNVHVHLGEPEVKSDSAGKYTSYQFRFQIGTELHILSARYSVLWKFNEKVTNSYFGPHATSMPKFPPKTWLRDMTKPKNYHKRAEELHAFLKALLQDAEFLKWSPFHDLLNLPQHLKKKMIEIADSMKYKADVIGNFYTDEPRVDKPIICNPLPDKKPPNNPEGEKMLDNQLKEILAWAEESFMRAEQYDQQGGFSEESGENSERKKRYAEELKGMSSVPQFRPDKDYQKAEQPNVEGFVNEIDTLFENFEIELFPEIAKV